MALSKNIQAPDFTLPCTNGNDFSLSQDMGGKPLILYFYPKDFTPGCTTEACDFRDSFAVFRDLDIPIYGISGDSIAKHQQFREAHKLPFHLLADEKLKVARQYKAYIPVLNMPRRVTYLLDKDHKIAAVFEALFNAKQHIVHMVEQVKGSAHQ